ncbi:MAG: WD40/YVTN/BNR-like repeat-containing protein [Actinomycetota bacterium]
MVGIGALVIFLPDGGDKASGGEPFVGGDLHSLVVDPSTGRLYVGGHQGVASSADGGRTWRQIDTLNNADAMGWAFTDRATLVGGHPGISVSTDGGATFEQRNEGLPATDIHGLGSDGEVLFAASPQVGILTSSDGGQTWEVVTDQVGQSFMGRILVDPNDPTHIVAPDMQSGAVESVDGGRTWSVLGGVQGAMWVSWEPANTDRVIVTGIGQAAESTDGGATWNEMEIPAGASMVEIDSQDPETLYAAVHQGQSALVWKSADAGRTWTRA